MRKKSLNLVSILLVVCTLFLTLTGCHEHDFKRVVKEELKVAEANYEHATIYKMSCDCGKVSEQTFQVGKTLKYEVGENTNLLKDKKVLFIGNSYTYHGNVVIRTGREYKKLDENRLNDQGYFYYMCKQSGADVSVTDWCYGGHSFKDHFGEACRANRGCDGYNHYAQLTDKKYDIVVLQDSRWSSEEQAENPDYVAYVKGIFKIFQDANPNVKIFFFFQPAIIFQADTYHWKGYVKQIEDETAAIVVDWGTLVYDIWTGAAKVPNSKYTYNKESFIISKSRDDGYHQNMLAGYLTTLMLYCTITGETAVGQPFKFATDITLDALNFNTAYYKEQYYKYIEDSNFDVILEDAEEMRNLQILADEYIRTQQYTKYCN